MFSYDEVESVKKDFWAARDEAVNLEDELNSQLADGISDIGYFNDLQNRYSYLTVEVLPSLRDRLKEMGETDC